MENAEVIDQLDQAGQAATEELAGVEAEIAEQEQVAATIKATIDELRGTRAAMESFEMAA